MSQFHIAGQDTESEGKKVFADEENVTPDFFRLLGIPILSGTTCRMNSDPASAGYRLGQPLFRRPLFSGPKPHRAVREEYYPAPASESWAWPVTFASTVMRAIRNPRCIGAALPYNPGPEFLLRTVGRPDAAIRSHSPTHTRD